ncbi:hypothetical protein FO519_005019 [Halicephalobus sp. NKZ332]|nr:hypothetical protein FO519_005019 [Halicephalobus sp. NKZ332]
MSSDNSMLSQLLFSEDDIPEYEFANPRTVTRSNPFYSNNTLSAEEQSLQDAQDILDRANVIAQLGCFHHSMFYEFDVRQGKNPGVDTRTPEEFVELDRRAEILYGRKIFTNPPEDVDAFFKGIRGIPSARQRYQYARRENASPEEHEQFRKILCFENLLPPSVYFAHVIYQCINHPVLEFIPYSPSDGYKFVPELPDHLVYDSNSALEQVMADFDLFDLPSIS